MADFATYDDLERIARGINTRSILKEASDTTQGKTVFLSHSSKDAHLLPAVVYILESHGARAYVDLGDNRLPETPSTHTGRIIRETITACRKLVMFVTTNSKDSRWVPWELGVADGQKTEYHVTLFPSAKHAWEQTWAGTEYLGLYTRIVWDNFKGETKKQWLVYNHHNNTATRLSEWITR